MKLVVIRLLPLDPLFPGMHSFGHHLSPTLVRCNWL